MTKKDVGSLALRLMGIYILAQTLLVLPMIGGVIREAGSLSSSGISIKWGMLIISQILPIALVIAGASALAIRSNALAGYLFEDADVRVSTTLTREDAQRIGLSLIGASLLAHAFPQFAKFGMWASMESDNLFAGMLRNQSRVEFVELTAQLVVGLGLFWGARGIAGMWRLLRELRTSR